MMPEVVAVTEKARVTWRNYCIGWEFIILVGNWLPMGACQKRWIGMCINLGNSNCNA